MPYDGLTQGELAARLRSPAVLMLPRVTSTLDVLHELAADGAPHRTLVLADEQTQGRGRMGRRWHSPPGAGIWMSFLHRPDEAVESGVVSLRVALAIGSVLRDLGAPVTTKWPNDLLIGGRKVCGVLSEGRGRGSGVDWIAIGVGMNVHGPTPAELRAQAAAVDEFVPGITRMAVLEPLVPALHRLATQPTLTNRERDQFEAHHWLTGREIAGPVHGTVEGIDLEGRLCVRTASGVERVTGGHVVTA